MYSDADAKGFVVKLNNLSTYSGEEFEYYRDAYINAHASNEWWYCEWICSTIKTIEREPSGHELTGILIKECSECFQRFALVQAFGNLYWVRADDYDAELEKCSVAKMKRALL